MRSPFYFRLASVGALVLAAGLASRSARIEGDAFNTSCDVSRGLPDDDEGLASGSTSGGTDDEALAVVGVDEQRAALVGVTTFAEAVDLRQRAAGVIAYHRGRQDGSRQAVSAASAFKVRVERHTGIMLVNEVPHGGDPRSTSSGTSLKLADLGISADESSKWRRLARVEDDKFEEFIEEATANDAEVTTTAALRFAQQATSPDTGTSVGVDRNLVEFEIVPGDAPITVTKQVSIAPASVDEPHGLPVTVIQTAPSACTDRSHVDVPILKLVGARAGQDAVVQNGRRSGRGFSSTKQRVEAVDKFLRTFSNLDRALAGSKVGAKFLDQVAERLDQLRRLPELGRPTPRTKPHADADNQESSQ